MNYMKYKRFFVLMEEAETERSRGEKRPGGNVKIETGNRKGAMSCTVQNLKSPSEKPCQYKLIFFGKRREKTIYALAGNLAVNREGNGETHFRFDPNNFDGKGNGKPQNFAFVCQKEFSVDIWKDKYYYHLVRCCFKPNW